MRVLRYAFLEAWASIRRRRGSSAFAVAAIGLAIVVFGSLLLVTTNVQRALAIWSTAAEFSVYLRDDATPEQRGTVESSVDGSRVAARREYVSKRQALNRFRGAFAELSAVAEAMEDNPFPASIEVEVRTEAQGTGAVDALVAGVARLPGVADVRYDREWIQRAAAGLNAVRRVGFVLVFVMMSAAALTVAAVVRLALYARRDELEIMYLVGSPYAYIRGPFVAEGLLQGGVGALLALTLLWAGYEIALSWWGQTLSALGESGIVQFLPASLCVGLVLGGMAIGCAGGFAAARTAL